MQRARHDQESVARTDAGVALKLLPSEIRASDGNLRAAGEAVSGGVCPRAIENALPVDQALDRYLVGGRVAANKTVFAKPGHFAAARAIRRQQGCVSMLLRS